jgi:hypothetical protein
MKLVINSNLFYKKALNILFGSLQKVNFTRFEDIILVISQYKDIGPRVKKIKEVTDLDLDNKITVICMEMNNFDYSAYHALYTWRWHNLIIDKSYFYILDTTTFHPSFNEKYETLESIVKNYSLHIISGPHSNICVFGGNVIDKYADNFKNIMTKEQAIILECLGESIQSSQEARVDSIKHFGEVVSYPRRIFVSKKDLYNNGIERSAYYYESFGLYKWILGHKNGDFLGNIVNNFENNKHEQIK